MDNAIQQLLITLPDEKLKLVLSIRDLLLRYDSSMQELIKYGRISYQNQHKKDIAFLCIHAKHSYIELGFFDGVHLENSMGLL